MTSSLPTRSEMDEIVEAVPQLDGQSATALSRFNGLSLHEKKRLLIIHEMETQGMGKYQWCVWLLCGLGYFIDMAWASAFGLLLSPLKQELGFGNGQSGNIATSLNAGLTTGALFWGVMSDVIGMLSSPRSPANLTGRRWAFNLTCLVSAIFGLSLGAASNYSTFLVLTALTGFGIGGNVPIDTAIVLEFIPQNRRFLLTCLSLFQPLGVIFSSAVGFAFIPNYSCSPNFSQKDPLPSCFEARDSAPCCTKSDNMGWRYMVFALGVIALLAFIIRVCVFTLRETPKFLLSKNRDQEAVEVLRYIANFNRKTCSITEDMILSLERSHTSAELEVSQTNRQRSPAARSAFRSSYMNVFRQFYLLFDGMQMVRLTVLIWLTYIMDFWSLTVAAFYLPRILALRHGSSVSLEQTYATYIYTYIPGIVGVLLGGAAHRIPNIGRKLAMVLSSGLVGASLFLFSVADTRLTSEFLFSMDYFFESMLNAVLYGWTPEAYPANIRGTGSGTASCWGRLSGIVSPLVAQHLYAQEPRGSSEGNVNGVLYLAGGVYLGCVVTTALLPTKLQAAEDDKISQAPCDAS